MDAPQWSGPPGDDNEWDDKPADPNDSWEPPDHVPDEQLSAEDFADHIADWQRNLK